MVQRSPTHHHAYNTPVRRLRCGAETVPLTSDTPYTLSRDLTSWSCDKHVTFTVGHVRIVYMHLELTYLETNWVADDVVHRANCAVSFSDCRHSC